MARTIRTRCVFVMLFLVTGIVGNAYSMNAAIEEVTSQFKRLGLFEYVSNPVWDTKVLEGELAVQHYDVLMPKLYWFFANKKEPVVIDWITQMSEQGHVPLLYLLARNFYNLSIGNGVISTEMLEKGLAYVMITLIRLQQDIACCKAFHDVERSENFYKFLKGKFWKWYGDAIKVMKDEDKVFSAVLVQTATWFNKRDLSKIHPMWVLNCKGSTFTWGIDFATPSLEASLEVLRSSSGGDIAQGFAKARSRVCEEQLSKMRQCKTFTQFFADATRRTSKDEKTVVTTGSAAQAEPFELGVAKAPGTYVVSQPEPEELGDPVADAGVKTQAGTGGQETKGAVQDDKNKTDAGSKSLRAQLLDGLVYYAYGKWVTQAKTGVKIT